LNFCSSQYSSSYFINFHTSAKFCLPDWNVHNVFEHVSHNVTCSLTLEGQGRQRSERRVWWKGLHLWTYLWKPLDSTTGRCDSTTDPFLYVTVLYANVYFHSQILLSCWVGGGRDGAREIEPMQGWWDSGKAHWGFALIHMKIHINTLSL